MLRLRKTERAGISGDSQLALNLLIAKYRKASRAAGFGRVQLSDSLANIERMKFVGFGGNRTSLSMEQLMPFASRLFCVVIVSAMLALPSLTAEDPVYSGPQKGEKLASFKVTAVYDDDAGKEYDPIEVFKGKPTLLIFVHKVTRPGVALTRSLTAYAKSLSKQGASGGIVMLDDDRANAEQFLNRARQGLGFTVPVGVSVDGGEGPGAYGLNRNVELTILVAKDNVVTANFALVQPSVSEAPQIAGELAKLVGQPTPKPEEIQKLAYPGRMQDRAKMANRRDAANRGAANNSPNALRDKMVPVIRAVSDEQLEKAVGELKKWISENEGQQVALDRMIDAILDRGVGSPEAHEQLKKLRSKKKSDDKSGR